MMSVVYRNKNSRGHERRNKAVSFDEQRLREQGEHPDQVRPHSTGNLSSLNPWNKGYSTNSLYWGFKQQDVQKLRSGLSDNQSKSIQSRITRVERHFGDLCTDFGTYTRKLSRVRNAGDDLGRSMMKYAENETLNSTTKYALRDFVENFAGVQDFRDIQVQHLESRVVSAMGTYGHQCKVAKERLKKAFAARDRELKQKKKLDSVKDKKPSDRHTIAESDLYRASVDASHSSKMLEEEMDSFEKKKLSDIKSILLEFVNIELLFHAKTLEMYTMCYHSLTTMDEEQDLEEFRNSLRPPAIRARQEHMRQASGSRMSLTSTGQSYTHSQDSVARPRQGTSSMNGSLNTSSQYTIGEEDSEEDVEEESEEGDEETEEDETELEPPTKRPLPVLRKAPTYSMFQASSPNVLIRKK